MNPQIIEKIGKAIVVAVGATVGIGAKKYGPKFLEFLGKLVKK